MSGVSSLKYAPTDTSINTKSMSEANLVIKPFSDEDRMNQDVELSALEMHHNESNSSLAYASLNKLRGLRPDAESPVFVRGSGSQGSFGSLNFSDHGPRLESEKTPLIRRGSRSPSLMPLAKKEGEDSFCCCWC
jgi:hypothetical protein